MCLGIPGQLVEIIDLAEHRAIVDVDGVRREINIRLVAGDTGSTVEVGDWVLIHVGFAMSKIGEQEAAETLQYMRGLGDVYEQEMTDFKQEAQL
jgi:hydrogenase expression/formation protein HypC